MKKMICCTVLSMFMFGGFAAIVSAADGNYRKGKYTFKKSCRACHNDDSAVALSPDSKTQAQWKRIFKPGKHKKLDCTAEWEKLSDKQLNDIFSYLHKYAYDSPSPAKCK